MAGFPCVRFGLVMRQRECLGVVKCHWYPVLPVVIPSPRYLKEWGDILVWDDSDTHT